MAMLQAKEKFQKILFFQKVLSFGLKELLSSQHKCIMKRNGARSSTQNFKNSQKHKHIEINTKSNKHISLNILIQNLNGNIFFLSLLFPLETPVSSNKWIFSHSRPWKFK